MKFLPVGAAQIYVERQIDRPKDRRTYRDDVFKRRFSFFRPTHVGREKDKIVFQIAHNYGVFI
jgi:hypothetical protein